MAEHQVCECGYCPMCYPGAEGPKHHQLHIAAEARATSYAEALVKFRDSLAVAGFDAYDCPCCGAAIYMHEDGTEKREHAPDCPVARALAEQGEASEEAGA